MSPVRRLRRNRIGALLELGEIRSLDVELLEDRVDAAGLHGVPYTNPALWFRCLRLILDEDVTLAERHAQAMYEQSPQEGTVAQALYTSQLGLIRWMQGRVDELEEGFLASRRNYPDQPLWSVSLAWLWLLQGRRASSETLLRTLPPIDQIVRDRYWLSTITVLAEIARSTGSRRNAEDLRNFLLAERAKHRPRIRVLGGFEVFSLCGTPAVWTSRKARKLLKMMVAMQGVATSREVFMEVLWPGEPPAVLSNRFSVAVNAVRRSLDVDRLFPTQHYVVTEGNSVRLEVSNLDVDLESFLSLAQHRDEASREAAKKLYGGPAFSEEPYADWAVDVRNHAERLRNMLD